MKSKVNAVFQHANHSKQWKYYEDMKKGEQKAMKHHLLCLRGQGPNPKVFASQILCIKTPVQSIQ